MRPPNRGVGHIPIQSGGAQSHQHKTQQIQQPFAAAWRGVNDASRQSQCRRGQRQQAGQQQRPQGQHRPIHQNAPRQRTLAAHPPDVVELAVHGQYQGQRGEQQYQGPDPTDFTGLAGKLIQVPQHLLGDIGWHQALQQPALQHLLQPRKHRKSAEHRQHHAEQRHQRNQGGKRQAAGGQAQAVFAKTLAQGYGCVAPRKGARIAHQLRQQLWGAFQKQGQRHAGIMPPARLWPVLTAQAPPTA